MTRFLLAAALLLLPVVARATDKDLRSMAAMQQHQRVLLVFAPSIGDPRLQRQRGEMARAGLEASERDLVLVEVGGDTVLGAHDGADKLRVRFKVPADAYRTLLIGKDGNAAMTVVGPISAAHIMAAIDAMPMRQDELRRAREGKGKPDS